MNDTIHKVIIIGSGPAGLTAGIYASRANLNPLIFEGKNPGGQLMGTSYVENWPGHMQILGPQLMANMKEHAIKTGAQIIDQSISAVDFSKKPFTITTDKNETYKAHAIIIATGATPKRLKVPGEDQYWGKGVTCCAVCDGAFYKDKPVIVVGGGDTAMEDSSFMLNYTNKITIVHILDKLTASAAMQERVLNNPAITIIYNSTLSEIKGDGQHVNEVVITNQKTKEKKTLKTDAVFVAIGLNPNTAAFKGTLDLNEQGYILLPKEGQTMTSIEGIFAAGDVHDYRYRQAITSAGSGCMAALDAERYLKKVL
jgi:thioredoxin reductase (NADPH)